MAKVVFHSQASVNSVVWITSLHENEIGVTNRILEDLEPYLLRKEALFEHHTPASAEEFLISLDYLAHMAERGLLPILHLDMHGSERDGVHIAATSENIPWRMVVEKFRRINVATRNNLCVVSMACFSFQAAREIQITSNAPFYILAAPEKEVHAGFIEESLNSFYEHVFDKEELITPFRQILAKELLLLHSEELLYTSLARYIRAGCIGKAGRMRAEELLTAGLKRLPGFSANKKVFRDIIRKGIKPSQQLLDRYVESFLLGKPVSFTIEQVVAEAEALPDPYADGKRARPSVEDSLRDL
ncbi:hypothetical protein [Agrobacterium radiobacter]|uniref:hypothetical protein n=1 Tax=Agrobacterium radiobacter TaxID=362 RepID=UPI003CF19B42